MNADICLCSTAPLEASIRVVLSVLNASDFFVVVGVMKADQCVVALRSQQDCWRVWRVVERVSISTQTYMWSGLVGAP